VSADWDELAEWWVGEIESDPSYAEDVVPLAVDLLGQVEGLVLDVGCGEGQVMRALAPRHVVGCDLSAALLRHATATAPGAAHLVRCRLPGLAWARAGAFGAATAVTVFEHLADVTALFAELARVVATGGILVVVSNHPAFTPPGAGPIVDVTDGEVLWRWGDYLDEAAGEEPAGDGWMTFHHRPVGMLLGSAAQGGWALERCEERGISAAALARHPEMAGQEHLPRLIGLRWRRLD
jgi:SAM-dependent methyltransferase